MEREKAQLELSANEISNILLENVACGVILFAYHTSDSNYHVLYSNRSAEMMEQMSSDEMQGMTLLELFPYGDGETLQQIFDDVRTKALSRRLGRTLLRGVYAEGWRECFLKVTDQGKLLMIYLDMTHTTHRREPACHGASVELCHRFPA